MALVKFQPVLSSGTTNFPDCIRVSNTSLYFNTELWTSFGLPEKVNIYYDEENHILGIKPNAKNDPIGIKVCNTPKCKNTKQIYIKSVANFFKLHFDKPITVPFSRNRVEEGIYLFDLKKGF